MFNNKKIIKRKRTTQVTYSTDIPHKKRAKLNILQTFVKKNSNSTKHSQKKKERNKIK